MSANGRKMKSIDKDIAGIDEQIARLQGIRKRLLQTNALLQGQEQPASAIVAERRKRSPNIKPLIIDIMIAAAHNGATSTYVSAIVKERVPVVAKNTVGCVLSRLKADSALVFDGERYYESRFAPKSKPHPFELKVARVS
jgi:hypothetical protein